jgi:hypothetical protein
MEDALNESKRSVRTMPACYRTAAAVDRHHSRGIYVVAGNYYDCFSVLIFQML